MHFKKYSTFYSLLAIGILRLLVHHYPGINEFDVVVYARHFINPDWIPGDWYLNQNIAYRHTFNLLAGGLSLVAPIWAVILMGRAFLILLFALIMNRYCREFHIPAFVILPLFTYFIANQSLVAGEWMIGGFEAKTLAYICFLMALLLLIKKRYNWGAFLSGLALSFHILIGLYGSFCLFIAMLTVEDTRLKNLKLSRMITSGILWLLGGTGGVYAIAQYLKSTAQVNKDLAASIYVFFRVPHHVLPSAWNNSLWIVALAILLIILIRVFNVANKRNVKMLTSAALCSLFLFGIGILFYLAGMHTYLRYYWFRLGDVFLPFTLMILLGISFSLMHQGRLKLGHRKILKNKAKNGLKIILIVLSGIAMLYAGVSFVKDVSEVWQNRKYNFVSIDENRAEMLLWISQNTPKNAVFLVSPTMQDFYYLAERPMFVSLKHSPQNDGDILEWYHRLNLLNGNNELPSGRNPFLYRRELNRQFYQLNAEQIQRIKDDYQVAYYLGLSGQKLPFRTIHLNDAYRLYSIE
ncbi:hypothetical protein JW877_05620 [bacterium]|nr:hypothetical protein [bacterium]